MLSAAFAWSLGIASSKMLNQCESMILQCTLCKLKPIHSYPFQRSSTANDPGGVHVITVPLVLCIMIFRVLVCESLQIVKAKVYSKAVLCAHWLAANTPRTIDIGPRSVKVNADEGEKLPEESRLHGTTGKDHELTGRASLADESSSDTGK